MRTGCVLCSCLLAACQVDHHITLLLGPDADTLTSGFTCPDPSMPAAPLLARGYVPATQTLNFTLVVDVIDLGDTLPNCLGEDVEAACADGNSCQLKIADAPRRACVELHIPNITDLVTAPLKVRTYLADNLPEIVSSAPHRPVMIRAVATQESCATIKTPAGDVWPELDPAAALGCAYSCPVNLDDAQDTIFLGLGIRVADLTPEQCANVVQACAQFPAIPQL